jgi:nicotinamide phosphoribosyltransferase
MSNENLEMLNQKPIGHYWTNTNPLLMIDVYKLGHMLFYKKGTSSVYSYMCARSVKKSTHSLFFGLQPYLYILAQVITQENADEFFAYYEETLGYKPSARVIDLINGLVGRPLPLEIKAVPEGTFLDNKNVLVTIRSTEEKYFWLGGFFESLLLKVWNTTSVATLSNKYKQLAEKYTKETSDSDFLLPFLVHDFGYRGVSSEMSAESGGAAHLINFVGTDTLVAIKWLKNNYAGTGMIGVSVAASEHSIHMSFGHSLQDAKDYVNNMLDEVPTGLVSVVLDLVDYFRELTQTLTDPQIKERILAREGKFVCRPDSGDPETILCGTIKTIKDIKQAIVEPYTGTNTALYELDGTYYKAEINLATNNLTVVLYSPTPEEKGTFRILEENFGATVNSKGYKELNPKIGVIYGDAMHYDRYSSVLAKMKEMGFANTNLVIGVGGLLLQQHNRDDLGFAFKATFAVINGETKELFKDPKTDSGKKSHKGLMCLVKRENGKYETHDQVTWEEEKESELVTVFLNGKVTKEYTLEQVRANSLGRGYQLAKNE